MKLKLSNIFKNITRNLYYKSGDTITNSDRLIVPAVLTSSGKQLYVTIPLAKKPNHITSATIIKFICGFRTSSGGYLTSDNYDWVSNSSSVTTYVDKETQTVTFVFVTSGTWGTNNTIYTGIIAEGNMSFVLGGGNT